MRITVLRDKATIEELVLRAKDSTSPMLRSNIAYLLHRKGCSLLLPGAERKVNGLSFLFSFGRDVDGGPAALEEGECTVSDYEALLREAARHHAGVVLTLRPWIKHHRIVLGILGGSANSAGWPAIYPRILVVPRSFNRYFSSISKKARNRYRYFLRHGGFIEEADPLRHVMDIARINLSSPVRQGRPLPRDYVEPMLIARSAAGWARMRSLGKASFYIAVLGERVVGYAYIPHLNGHAYASRFLVHSRYMGMGTGNALLLEIIRDLAETGKARILQYGYWRNVNPGINRFLAQHRFKTIPEPIVIMGRWRLFLRSSYGLWVKLTNIAGRNRLLGLWQRLSGRA